MIVPVHFPDGSVRDIACDLRPTSIGRSATPAAFELVPLQCDARWKFERAEDRWRAVPRLNSISRLKVPVEEWWRSIVQLADDSHVAHPALRPSQNQSQRRAVGE